MKLEQFFWSEKFFMSLRKAKKKKILRNINYSALRFLSTFNVFQKFGLETQSQTKSIVKTLN